MVLRDVNFVLHHIPGVDNILADLFSRFLNPGYVEPEGREGATEYANRAVLRVIRRSKRIMARNNTTDAAFLALRGEVQQPRATTNHELTAAQETDGTKSAKKSRVRQSHQNQRTDDFAPGRSLVLAPANAAFPTLEEIKTAQLEVIPEEGPATEVCKAALERLWFPTGTEGKLVRLLAHHGAMHVHT